MADATPRSTTAAWAAAAVVLAIGALGIAVAAQLRAEDLERRLDAVEASVDAPAPTTASTSAPDRPDRSSTTSTVAAPTTPVDPEAARRAIERAFATVYDGSAGPERRTASVDDPTGVERALQDLFAGPYSVGARTSRAVVGSVEFASVTRAMVVYTVAIDGAPALATRTGEARVVGGDWKVTRATVCADLAALAAPCP